MICCLQHSIFGKCGQMRPRPGTFVAKYSAVPRTALASAKESFGFGGLPVKSPDGETSEVEKVSREREVLVVEEDLVVLVLVR